MNLLDALSQEIATLNKCDISEVLVDYHVNATRYQPSKLTFYITKNPVSGHVIKIDLYLIKEYLLNKYNTKLLIGDKGKYIIMNIRCALKQDIFNDVKYYIYWEYELLDVLEFQTFSYFESLNHDIITIVLSKLKYGNVFRTIYNNTISDIQIVTAVINTIPTFLLNAFEDLKVRYKKHPDIFESLNNIFNECD